MSSSYALCGCLSCVEVGAQRIWKIVTRLVEFDREDFVMRFDIFCYKSLVRSQQFYAAQIATGIRSKIAPVMLARKIATVKLSVWKK
jgi:hypothetical protein